VTSSRGSGRSARSPRRQREDPARRLERETCSRPRRVPRHCQLCRPWYARCVGGARFGSVEGPLLAYWRARSNRAAAKGTLGPIVDNARASARASGIMSISLVAGNFAETPCCTTDREQKAVTDKDFPL